jgi:hypothetical protein
LKNGQFGRPVVERETTSAKLVVQYLLTNKGGIMRPLSEFQNDVKDLLGDNMNFQVDRPHAGKDKHVDLTTIVPAFRGADKVEVDFNGNIIGGSTQIGKTKLDWNR